jgi:hypothetical protein
MCYFGVSVWHHLHWNSKVELKLERQFTDKKNNLTIQQLTLFVPHIWFSLSTSMHVRSVIKDWLMLPVNETSASMSTPSPHPERRSKPMWNWPASRRRLPSALVLLVRSLPAKSTRHSWLTFTWFLS